MKMNSLQLILSIFLLLAAGVNLTLFAKNILKRISGIFLIRSSAVLFLLNLSGVTLKSGAGSFERWDYPLFAVSVIIVLTGMFTDFIILLNIYTAVIKNDREIDEIKGGEG